MVEGRGGEGSGREESGGEGRGGEGSGREESGGEGRGGESVREGEGWEGRGGEVRGREGWLVLSSPDCYSCLHDISII